MIWNESKKGREHARKLTLKGKNKTRCFALFFINPRVKSGQIIGQVHPKFKRENNEPAFWSCFKQGLKRR